MESDWQEKIWGKTRCHVNSPFYSEHELMLKEGGYCSFHYHLHRANRFIVHSGKVKIVRAFGWDIKTIILEAGDEYDVSSLIPHQFQVIETSRMTEMYFPDRKKEISNDDIIRLSMGGKINRENFNLPGIILSDGTFWKVVE